MGFDASVFSRINVPFFPFCFLRWSFWASLDCSCVFFNIFLSVWKMIPACFCCLFFVSFFRTCFFSKEMEKQSVFKMG
ncbi:hypothetical protein BC829DRAFT_409226, partial [Chytridium lagenaria]